MNHLLDHELDLSGFDARFGNDLTGAPAYPPAMLLKVALSAYSQGIVSRRPHMLEQHREEDRRAIEPDLQTKETQRIARLQTDANRCGANPAMAGGSS